jgi:hypothetical protein
VRDRVISPRMIVSSVQSQRTSRRILRIRRKANLIMRIRMTLMTQRPVRISVRRDWIGTRWRKRRKERTERS